MLEQSPEAEIPPIPKPTYPPCPICGGEMTAQRCTECGADVIAIIEHVTAKPVESTRADLEVDVDTTDLFSLVRDALLTKDAHQKQWYLEQIAAWLNVDLSGLDYELGIAP